MRAAHRCSPANVKNCCRARCGSNFALTAANERVRSALSVRPCTVHRSHDRLRPKYVRAGVRARRRACNQKCQPAYKPGSVGLRVPCGARSVTAIPLGRSSPIASSNQPGRRGRKPPALSRMSPLFGFAPGGVCRAARVAAGAVRSYRTLSPLPRAEAQGGLLSVALSLGLPPPDVIRHRVSMEPGLSSAKAAAVRPAGIRDVTPRRRRVK
jgi:hypothetical protein